MRHPAGKQQLGTVLDINRRRGGGFGSNTDAYSKEWFIQYLCPNRRLFVYGGKAKLALILRGMMAAIGCFCAMEARVISFSGPGNIWERIEKQSQD